MKRLNSSILIFIFLGFNASILGIFDCWKSAELPKSLREAVESEITIGGDTISGKRSFDYFLGQFINESLRDGKTKNLVKLLKWAKKLSNEDYDESVSRVLRQVEVIKRWHTRTLSKDKVKLTKNSKVKNYFDDTDPDKAKGKILFLTYIKNRFRKKNRKKLQLRAKKTAKKNSDNIETTLDILKNYFDDKDASEIGE